MTDQGKETGKQTGPMSYSDTVRYGRHAIDFDVVHTERQTLGIHVHPSRRVEVRAPLDAEPETVRDRVRRRARWILRHQRRFASLVQPPTEKEYRSGETHRYLGRQYRLKIIPIGEDQSEGASKPGERVRLAGRYFEVYTAKPDDPAHTRSLLEQWYRRKAERHLRERFAQGCARMKKYGITAAPVMIRKMNKRWGSCTPAGRVILNPRLILAPTACIDYIIMHELCHLKHPHHGPAFYEFLSRVMPDWEERKWRLENVQ